MGGDYLEGLVQEAMGAQCACFPSTHAGGRRMFPVGDEMHDKYYQRCQNRCIHAKCSSHNNGICQCVLGTNASTKTVPDARRSTTFSSCRIACQHKVGCGALPEQGRARSANPPVLPCRTTLRKNGLSGWMGVQWYHYQQQ